MIALPLRRLLAGITLSLSTVVGLTGCTTNPATGRASMNMLSEQEEIQIGTEAEPQFLAEYGGPIPDAAIQSYVATLGKRLAAVSERPEMPWTFHAVDSSVINAFALPGGKIFITRGLMERLESEGELAGVLGHEVGHVTGEHIGQQMTQAMVLQAGIAVIGVAAGEDYQWASVLGGVGGQLYLLNYGRSQESEADTLGMRYMVRLGYDPAALLGVMNVLAEAMGEGRQPELLSTHPHPETRIATVEKAVKGEYAHTQGNPQFITDPANYQTQVLARLKKLPAAKHGSASLNLDRLETMHAAIDRVWAEDCDACSGATGKQATP